MLPILMGVTGTVLITGSIGKALRNAFAPTFGSALLALVTASLVNWHAFSSPWAALGVALPMGILAYLSVLKIAGRQHLRELQEVTGILRAARQVDR